MKVCGIISEYNPFHRGHAYHIAETKRLLDGACAVICVMSGNFVQRGDFAVFEKHARAAAAVASGADLVLELPLTAVLSSAERYAMGAVQLLDSLNVCTHLSFGSEAGDLPALETAARWIDDPAVDRRIKAELEKGISYPAARQNAVGKAAGDAGALLSAPNNILGIEYIRAIRRLGSKIRPVTVLRMGAGHDAMQPEADSVSATYLRQVLFEGADIRRFVPPYAAEIYAAEMAAGRGPVQMRTIEAAVLARLRRMTAEDYEQLPDGSEGLYLRLMRCGQTEPTLDRVAERAKSKRYTLSRIRRMILCAFLGIEAADIGRPPQYARVLAFNDTGRRLLREIGAQSSIPVITKPAAAGKLDGQAGEMFKKEAAATDLYTLAYPDAENRQGGQEWTVSPRYIR